MLEAGIQPEERGLIYGDNRIAQLTKCVLSTAGLPAVETHRMDSSMLLEMDAYDFVIETQSVTPAFDEIIWVVRPGGRIILKSRPPHRRQSISRRPCVRRWFSRRRRTCRPWNPLSS